MSTIYSTRNEAIQQEIIEPLGSYADEHNIDAIADDIIHQANTRHGEVYYFNAMEDDPEAFWEIVADHAITA